MSVRLYLNKKRDRLMNTFRIGIICVVLTAVGGVVAFPPAKAPQPVTASVYCYKYMCTSYAYTPTWQDAFR